MSNIPQLNGELESSVSAFKVKLGEDENPRGWTGSLDLANRTLQLCKRLIGKSSQYRGFRK